MEVMARWYERRRAIVAAGTARGVAPRSTAGVSKA
jgi:hypothetical protein